jgi:hypothetical protein
MNVSRDAIQVYYVRCPEGLRIVAARTKTAAFRLMGVSQYDMDTHGGVATDAKQVALATRKPGAVWQRRRGESCWENIPASD